MYDSHIYCEEYKELKDRIVDIINGDSDEDVFQIETEIQELYENGEIPASQYDDLMSYIQDLA